MLDFRQTLWVAVISGVLASMLTGLVSFLLNLHQNKIERKRRDEEWEREDKRRQEQWLLEDKRRREDWEKENYQRSIQWDMERKQREEEYEKQENTKRTQQRLESDRKMFERIQSTLTISTLDFIRGHDYHGSFRRSEHSELQQFVFNFPNLPENQFFDLSIEKGKQDLFKSIEEFLAFIGQYTFPVKDSHDSESNRIPVIHDRDTIIQLIDEAKITGKPYEDLERELIHNSKNYGDSLNRLVDKVCTEYDRFIQTARENLDI